MTLAAAFPFLNALWLICIFFGWVMVIAFVIQVLIDNFRRPDQSGWAKAGWTLLVIALPLLGAIVYQIARPRTEYVVEPWDSGAATAARDDATRIQTGLSG
jgi:NADH:ubiquinone oxidoreductase subunit 6 (subunit J)